MKKKTSPRRFTDEFLWAIIAVVLLAFIGLWIYQTTMNKPQAITPATSTQDQTAIAEELKIANQEALEKITLTLSEVPPINDADHLLGPLEAPAQLIIYTDFTDPLAAQFVPIIKELKSQFGDDLVVVWRQHPLVNNLFSNDAAIAIECAAKQDKLFDYAEQIALLSAQEQILPEWSELASELGLKVDDFNNCLTKPEVQATIDQWSSEAEALGAIGVPSSFLNKKLLSGVYPLEDFTDSDGQVKSGLVVLVQEAIKANQAAD